MCTLTHIGETILALSCGIQKSGQSVGQQGVVQGIYIYLKFQITHTSLVSYPDSAWMRLLRRVKAHVHSKYSYIDIYGKYLLSNLNPANCVPEQFRTLSISSNRINEFFCQLLYICDIISGSVRISCPVRLEFLTLIQAGNRKAKRCVQTPGSVHGPRYITKKRNKGIGIALTLSAPCLWSFWFFL